MTQLVLIGSGGHAREVLEIVRNGFCSFAGEVLARALEPIGFIDENVSRHGARLSGLPILGGFEWFDRPEAAGVSVICAVGSPHIRKRLAGEAEARGLRFASAISRFAVVSATSEIGEGAMVFPHAVVSTDVRIGRHVILNTAASVSHDSVVEDFCTINPGARLAGNVVAAEGAYLGMGCSVIQGKNVGAWSVVGAGAVAVADVPTHVTVVGVPARTLSKLPAPETKANG